MHKVISSEESTVQYLQSLEAIRERSGLVWEMGVQGKLNCWTVNQSKVNVALDKMLQMIEADYNNDKDNEWKSKMNFEVIMAQIPSHGRWRHFGISNIEKLQENLQAKGKISTLCALLDLFVVGVLVDAGAGDVWKFTDPVDGKVYCRSEGLAVAALRMFENGIFSSSSEDKLQVDSQGLANLTLDQVEKAFQVSESNPLLGVEGRWKLLKQLGNVINTKSEYFPLQPNQKYSRPSNFIFHLLPNISAHPNKSIKINIHQIWKVIIDGFGKVWPNDRLVLEGVPLGDVWYCDSISDYIPFHKLSQWLTYSLIDPIKKLLPSVTIEGEDKLTGLAEYRNGGFFYDLGIIQLKEGFHLKPEGHHPGDQVIVEWRALTIVLIDQLVELVRQHTGLSPSQCPVAKILEYTWNGGRLLAKNARPNAAPPIAIISDGTVF